MNLLLNLVVALQILAALVMIGLISSGCLRSTGIFIISIVSPSLLWLGQALSM